MTAEQLRTLVSAAVGADEARGDQVQVVVGVFDKTEIAPAAFYEQAWFAQILRIVAALIAVLLVLLLAVRPLIKAVRGAEGEKTNKDSKGKEIEEDEKAQLEVRSDESGQGSDGRKKAGDQGAGDDPAEASADISPEEFFNQRIGVARQLAAAEPARAVEVLQRMIDEPEEAIEKIAEEGA